MSFWKGRVFRVRQARNLVPTLLGRVIFIGFSVQIILGILWAFFAMPGFRSFQDSFFYLEVSDTLVWDEYTGILYPLLLRFLRGGCSFLPFSYTLVLYLLQLGAGFLAAAFLMESMWGAKGFWKIWGALVVLTVPVTLLCHLSVLPLSPAGSCLMVQLACLCRIARRNPGKQDLLKLCILQGVFCLLGGLFLPEYVIFGGIAALVTVIVCFHKKCYLGAALLVLACLLSIGGNSLVRTPGAWGRMHRSAESMLFERVAYNHLREDSYVWPDGLEIFHQDLRLSGVNHKALDRRDIMGPMIEEQFGVEASKGKYLALTKLYWQIWSKEVLYQIGWDAYGYFLPPPATGSIMEGRGYYNFVAKNYDAFLGDAPWLASKTYGYYLAWFVPAVMLSMVGIACLIWQKKPWKRQGFWRKMVLCPVCLICVGMVPLWYILQPAGTMDEKNVFVYLGLWYACMAGVCIRILGREKESVK